MNQGLAPGRCFLVSAWDCRGTYYTDQYSNPGTPGPGEPHIWDPSIPRITREES